MTIGLPVYGLWYAACGWWMFDYFTTWFAATCLVLMPFLGVLALAYWRSAPAGRLAGLASTSLSFPARSVEASFADSGRSLQRQLSPSWPTEYAAVAPRQPPEPKPDWRVVWRRRAAAAAAVVLLLLAAWFIWHHHWRDAAGRSHSGVDLAAVPRASLEPRLEADEKACGTCLKVCKS